MKPRQSESQTLLQSFRSAGDCNPISENPPTTGVKPMKNKTALIALAAFCVACGIATSAIADTPRAATFEGRQAFTVTVPDGAKKIRLWLAMPQDDSASDVRSFKVESPFPYSFEKDNEGNRYVFIEVNEPTQKEFTVVQTFTITRREILNNMDAASKATRPFTDEERAAMAKYLTANQHVIINDEIRQIAAKVVGDEKNPLLAARKLYDWTLDNIVYWVKDPKNKKASPVGSTEYCLANKTGNCTDFHSLWTSLARAAGIPTRIVYGSFFKKELNGQDADQSYHCWPEFYVPNVGWVPHDVAVAEIFKGEYPITEDNARLVRLTTADGYSGPDQAKVDYYFGNIDERRVVWSVGRDLILNPRQDGGPVNAIAKAYMEADGKPVAENVGWKRKLTFKEAK
jgi:transglutaminase-like putative cysteine protease